MKKLSNKEVLLVGLMLFSLFFGAGNLIFPPFLGQASGVNVWIAIGGFLITAVGFPVLGVVAVAKSGGLSELAKRVNPQFALVFTVLIYLSIGPCLGIPRAGSLPFEMMVAPYLPGDISTGLALFIFTVIFFSASYFMSLNPSKLVDRMGKILTPVLLILILVVFIGAIIKPMGNYGPVTGEYIENPFVKGFLEGYLTMDTIAALNFGIVVALAVKSKGVKEEKEVVSATIKSGIIAGIFLMLVYGVLAHLGASSGGRFGVAENGAQTLINISTHIFGKPGAALMGIIFTLACLTTCVGLISSCGQYFAKIIKSISYKKWVLIITVFSTVLANMGLNNILAVSVPVLVAIYPIAIVLIILALSEKVIKRSKYVYGMTVLFTGIISTVQSFDQAGIDLGIITKSSSFLPFYSEGLGWICPALIGILLGIVLKRVKDKKCSISADIQ